MEKRETPIALVMPDIHGRTFWKDAIDKFPELPVVFLGDYTDPYDNFLESISSKFAIRNLLEIMSFKCLNEECVTLLLGNHDIHYMVPDVNCSRKDMFRAYEIREIFESNLHHFRLAHTVKTENGEVLFTHAGVLPGWAANRLPEVKMDSAEEICDALNQRMEDRKFLSQLITDVSMYRGGWEEYGSPMWADVNEYEAEGALAGMPERIYQVFGHTQQASDPVITPRYACLDCRRAFVLMSDGTIDDYKMNP